MVRNIHTKWDNLINDIYEMKRRMKDLESGNG